ncbi:MAG: YjbH domain-containing protein, partial [Chlamydiales bacterium]
AGVAGELLWYPVDSCVAFGVEGAVLKKRSYTGLGFQSQLRRFDGPRETYSNYSSLQQYFLCAYLDIPSIQISCSAKGGMFLARDKGLYIDAVRYFDNGLRLGGWMTFTDAEDLVHGENYYNRGVILEIPFDFFSIRSSRKVYSNSIAAWLRDAGYMSSTGVPLFPTISTERRW